MEVKESIYLWEILANLYPFNILTHQNLYQDA